jgi:hypothetical protein
MIEYQRKRIGSLTYLMVGKDVIKLKIKIRRKEDDYE